MSNISEVDSLLRTALDTEIPENSRLKEAIAYTLFLPGKRIRPRLAIETCRMLGVAALPSHAVAAAIEMIHAFSLIHDDLPCMDNDDFRRGKPSNHIQNGEALALLAGDALLALAFKVYSRSAASTDPKRFQKGLMRLLDCTGPMGMIGGQARELNLVADPDLAVVKRIHREKTGALFQASILVPTDLAGIQEGTEEMKVIEDFAEKLGEAFQVADDLEDHSEGDVTNIFHYENTDEIIGKTHKSLLLATENLRSQWGNRATSLVAVAEEVAKRLVKA